MNAEPGIVSFVMRFVYDEPPGENERPTARYSVVRHVGSDSEHRFSSWAEIVAFIKQYVDLDKEPSEA